MHHIFNFLGLKRIVVVDVIGVSCVRVRHSDRHWHCRRARDVPYLQKPALTILALHSRLGANYLLLEKFVPKT